MTEQKRKIMIFAVLCVSVVFALLMRPWDRRSVEPTTDPMPISLDSTAQATSADPDLGIVLLAAVSDWPDNPFVRPEDRRVERKNPSTRESDEPAMPRLSLQGIVRTGTSLSCVINGQSLGVGESIGGWVIQQINEDAVMVSHNGRTYTLRL